MTLIYIYGRLSNESSFSNLSHFPCIYGSRWLLWTDIGSPTSLSCFLILIWGYAYWFERDRERERERETLIDWLPLTCALTEDQIHNLGMCPYQKLNLQCFWYMGQFSNQLRHQDGALPLFCTFHWSSYWLFESFSVSHCLLPMGPILLSSFLSYSYFFERVHSFWFNL